MQVEPANARPALAADAAELELAHEGRVEDGAGNQRDEQQATHAAEEELAGQAGVKVDVQAVHQRHEAAAEVGLAENLPGVAVDRDEDGVPLVAGDVAVELGVPQPGVILFGEQVERHQPGVRRQRRGNDAVGAGRAGTGGKRRGGEVLAGQLVDLVREDQRQAGQAEQQHEQRADQAGPLVDPAPGAQRMRRHQKSTVALSVNVRGVPRTR